MVETLIGIYYNINVINKQDSIKKKKVFPKRIEKQNDTYYNKYVS